MDAIPLAAQQRELTGKKVKQLRRQGSIPGTVYGGEDEARNVTVNYLLFEKVYRDAGESTLVDLKIGESGSVKTLIQDVQLDPILGEFLHVDFRQVNMKEEIETDVELLFEGEAPAVKEKGGILVRNLDTVTVRCLPGDLVHEIPVDLSPLKEIGDAIHVKDLPVPKDIVLVNDEDDLVVVVNEPISEEELKSLDEAPVEDVTSVASEEDEKAAEEDSEAATE